MIKEFTSAQALRGITEAAAVLNERKEEINRLNVFPVPDGDTGTNMALTLKSVSDNIAKLTNSSEIAARKKAITTGALMGARGNSGVITSQILRGLCEGVGDKDSFTLNDVDNAFQMAVEVAFKAVRKPVKGTILTVLEDTAAAAKHATKKRMKLSEGLEYIVEQAYISVDKTPEFLPVLKENGVVDAGGYGLSILIDAFVASILDKNVVGTGSVIAEQAAPKVEIEQINDWEGSKYRYCNEFLVDSDTLNANEALDFLSTMGDCELCVGTNPKFKVHVHSNTPDKVLAYFLECGQISEVFIHNMQLQSENRNAKLIDERTNNTVARKNMAVVAVAVGVGNEAILKSMGVDVVVSGGQTMNPSTADLLSAAQECNADNVIILPNNSNIIMAAQSAAELADFGVGVVPTKSLPAAFSALFEYNSESSLEDNISSMSSVLDDVKVAEFTTAIKNSKDAHNRPINEGDFIGITDGSIEAEGRNLTKVILKLLDAMGAKDADTCTVLAGEDFTDDDLEALTSKIEKKYGDLEIDALRGDQPLYPVIISVE